MRERAAAGARVEELAAFLEAEDFGGQFSIGASVRVVPDGAFFSLTVLGPDHRRRLVFDDSGVQDWAFTALLPQLDGEDPSFAAG